MPHALCTKFTMRLDLYDLGLYDENSDSRPENVGLRYIEVSSSPAEFFDTITSKNDSWLFFSDSYVNSMDECFEFK